MPAARHLLLVGAGHASIAVLRDLAQAPHPGLRVTVLTPSESLSYSGMLPGIVAGGTDPAAGRIDIARLAAAAGATLCLDRATGLDPDARRVLRAGGAPLGYDLLALDIGAPPASPAADGVIPV
ncbi:MAG TPA: pyridine nucleotide-disulfide oxidoreductase, partial [Acidiphilium sp.]|nr:pyridine nucleotide-disulfide oxidoreductase [Acidiphilium sp.]